MFNRQAAVLRGSLCSLLLILAACSGGGGGNRNAQAPEVGFVVVQPTSVPLSVTLAGRTSLVS